MYLSSCLSSKTAGLLIQTMTVVKHSKSAYESNPFRVHYPSPTIAEGKALLYIKTHADSRSIPSPSALKGSRPELESIKIIILNSGNHGKTHRQIAGQTKHDINIAEACDHGLINGSNQRLGNITSSDAKSKFVSLSNDSIMSERKHPMSSGRWSHLGLQCRMAVVFLCHWRWSAIKEFNKTVDLEIENEDDSALR